MNLSPKPMERKRVMGNGARILSAAGALFLAAATGWDLLRLARGDLTPAVSYVLVAAGVAAASAGWLGRFFEPRPRPLTDGPASPDSASLPQQPTVPGRGRLRAAIELFVIGLVLLGFWLRADPGIPADPPVVVVELLAALVLGANATFLRQRPVRSRITGSRAR